MFRYITKKQELKINLQNNIIIDVRFIIENSKAKFVRFNTILPNIIKNKSLFTWVIY